MSNICPISISQLKGIDQARLAAKIQSIPLAVDLSSAIMALNIINSIIQQLTVNLPQVNNLVGGGYGGSGGVSGGVGSKGSQGASGEPSQQGATYPGTDYNLHYIKANWLVESRTYTDKKLQNYDDATQSITIPILSEVVFMNANLNHMLVYAGAD